MKIIHLTWLGLTRYALILTLLISVNACRNITEVTKYDVTFLALTDNNTLITINSDDPSQVQKKTTLTGLDSGEKILGIDYRPATGQLYGVSSQYIFFY